MAACVDSIYGYTPANDVGNHLLLDLDLQSVITNVKATPNALLGQAFTAYSVGNDLQLHYTFLIQKQILMML
jgi:hypothetical protein